MQSTSDASNDCAVDIGCALSTLASLRNDVETATRATMANHANSLQVSRQKHRYLTAYQGYDRMLSFGLDASNFHLQSHSADKTF